MTSASLMQEAGRALKYGAQGQLRGMGWEGRWEVSSGWGGYLYTYG